MKRAPFPIRACSALLIFTAIGASVHAQAAKPEQVYFEPVVINNVTIQGQKAQFPINEPELRKELSVQFDKWMARSVPGNHLAGKATPIGTNKLAPGTLLLHATLNVPLTHAADMSHWDNQYKHGKFMDYRFSLTDASGKTVAEVKGDLTWGDGDWSHFMGRGRHVDTAHSEVLKGYVRKAVDRGVISLKKQVK